MDKIAFIGTKGLPTQYGGVERHVEELATRLVDLNLHITVYSRKHYNRSNKTYQGIRVITIPTIFTKHFDTISYSFLATLHAIWDGYDIIHYQGVGPALVSWIPRIFAPQTKIVTTFHCQDTKRQKWNKIAQWFLKLSEHLSCIFSHQVITVSKELRQYIWNNYQTKAQYIPNGASFNNQPENLKLIEQWKLKPNQYLLSVARLMPDKGQHYLIRTYRQIKKQLPKGLKLVIVGDVQNNSPYRQQLETLAGSDPDIIFTGWQQGSALETLYRQAKLFVQNSEYEGLSVSVLEAACLGVPVLVSNISSNLEATEGYGFSYKLKSSRSLAAQLRTLTKQPARLKKQALLGKQIVNQKYNWDDIAKQTKGLYQRLLAPQTLETHFQTATKTVR